jgi:glycosyltransferase involved in cell wall biosynthesis
LLSRSGRNLKLFIFTCPRLAGKLIAIKGYILNLIEIGSNKRQKRGFPGPSFITTKGSAGSESVGKKILFIEQTIPRIDTNAGAITIDQFMELFLHAGWKVTLWPQDRRFSGSYGAKLEQRGVEVLSSDRLLTTFARWWRTRADQYSVVLLSRPAVCAAFLPVLTKHGNPRILYYGHDLHFARLQSEAELTRLPELFWFARRFKKMESRVWKKVHCTYYPSTEEADTVRSLAPHSEARDVIPYFFNGMGKISERPPESRRMLFVGNFNHPPNVDAVEWLIQEIFPAIKTRCAEAELRIVGAGMPEDLQRRCKKAGIDSNGWISGEALAAAYKSCRLVVVPLRFGAGVKHKVAAALAGGLPVVMTRIGAQGMEWLGDSADIVDNGSEFAAVAARLLTDDAYWLQRAVTASRAVQNRFTVQAMSKAFDELGPVAS